MNLHTIKPDAWTELSSVSGSTDTLPADLSTKTAAVQSLSHSTPRKFGDECNGITYHVDFNASGGTADIYWYGFPNGGNTYGVYLAKHTVSAKNQAGTSLWRSDLQTLDIHNMVWLIAVPQNLGGSATTVTVRGMPI